MLPAPRELVGGKYRIVRLIGEGGMGVVYEAHHEHLGSEVALKFLHPDLAERPALVARFLQEARVSASIKSPHVTHVMDVDQTPEGAAYLVMELLEGESLEARLGRGAPLPQADAIDIGLQILAALEAAHARGVIHRDLKPDNVWLSPSARGSHVKLLDFGIAKLKASSEFQQIDTRPGSVMGTPAYMAPEQAISADQVDRRADLYSFGVILYEMLSGKRPVDADDPSEILEHLLRGDVHSLASRNPSLPSGLCSFVDRLVAPNPEKRPSSTEEARSELLHFARDGAHDAARAVVPDTVPPDDEGAPFVTRTQMALSAPTRTDAMPKMSDLAVAPAASPTQSPVRGRKSNRGSQLLWVLLVAALGGGGVWAYMNPSVFDDDPLPPMPGPAPADTVAPIEAATTRQIVPTAPAPPAVNVERPARTTPRPPASPEAPAPTTSAPPFSFPTLDQLPPFTLPSGFAIPSSLPPFLRQLPGMSPAAPTAPPRAAAPATTADPSGAAPGSSPLPLPRGRRERPSQ